MSDVEILESRYEVVRTVSTGRRASVLQALDRVHDRLVALKVYPVTDDARDELLSEARLLMSITPHPGLPIVRGDFFTQDGNRFVVVLNWVDGVDLQQALEEHGDPGFALDDVLDILEQVARALDHLHAHDPPIVHGDVKPANLVRGAGDRIVLVDFDIAGAHAVQGRVGTVGFVAPEVAAGDKPDPAADVFGLAATAVTLLSGEPPTSSAPTYAGLDASEQGQLGRVLRLGLAADPAQRPRSATRFVEMLRAASRELPPSGVLAFMAAEVFDATRLWADDADEMRVTMTRLRDARDEVVSRHGGHVVTSMNEGDRTIAVFREASSAARAALELHDRVARLAFPPGFEVQLRIAVAVGEAIHSGGVYSGAVVDHLLGLRSTAAPGTTITSEASAELLVGLVGHDVSIVPLGHIANSALPTGALVFGLTRPGAERTARLDAEVPTRSAPRPDAPIEPTVVDTVSRRAVALEAAQASSTLVAVTVVGVLAIFLAILAPEFDLGGLGAIALVLAAGAMVGTLAWNYTRVHADRRRCLEAERQTRADGAQALELAREREESRERLELGLARIGSDDGDDASQVLDSLSQEFDSIGELLRRTKDGALLGQSMLVPDLAEETYRHGMSALSDALQLLEFADGPRGRRLRDEWSEVTRRLESDDYADERTRERDAQREASRRHLVARHDDARQRARDLIFEAERCVAALAEAHIELASVRAGDTQVDVEAVVHTLQETIRRVRDVQVEMRRLGY